MIASRIKLQLEPLDYTVLTDMKWVDFILNQILVNAIKYRSASPSIHIYAQQEKNSVALTIADNGIGIRAADLPRVFERGFTGETGRKFSKATGLGLYLSKRMCDKLGIGLSLASVEGRALQFAWFFQAARCMIFQKRHIRREVNDKCRPTACIYCFNTAQKRRRAFLTLQNCSAAVSFPDGSHYAPLLKWRHHRLQEVVHMESILKVEHLEKYYGNRGNVTKAVDDISFTVTQGEYIGIMGASGSGKTTLLNCISTIDSATAGHIFIRGQDVTQLKAKELSRFRREQLGFIFQDSNLLDTLTAFENIALALTVIGTPAKEIDGRVHNVAKRLEIDSILGKYPYQLSGGQQQRVASARAMITNPSLILADEPTGALDSKSARMLLDSFETLNRELGATILMVTHDAFTASYCKRILFIKDGKIFNELLRGADTRKAFFEKIIEVVTLLGGGNGDVL